MLARLLQVFGVLKILFVICFTSIYCCNAFYIHPGFVYFYTVAFGSILFAGFIELCIAELLLQFTELVKASKSSNQYLERILYLTHLMQSK
jgi:hypothetical protein